MDDGGSKLFWPPGADRESDAPLIARKRDGGYGYARCARLLANCNGPVFAASFASVVSLSESLSSRFGSASADWRALQSGKEGMSRERDHQTAPV